MKIVILQNQELSFHPMTATVPLPQEAIQDTIKTATKTNKKS